MEPTADDVLAVVSASPLTVGDLGVEIAVLHGADRAAAQGQPVGQWLAAQGVSLSALQKVVDGLVHERRLVQVRGRQLWDLGLPTEGTRANGRYYLLPV